MGKPVSPQLQHAIEIIESLSPDEQWQLLEVVRQRLLEYQHAKPVKEAAEARRTYARYPLRGKPLRYVMPLESVAEEDWDALMVTADGDILKYPHVTTIG
jgi:pyruvate-formate lyase-activating enzyme